MPVNWKSVRDVDNEGYHVPVAHPALQDLYGNGYVDESVGFGITRSTGVFNDSRDRYWSVRNYKKILAPMAHLPEANQKAWYYYGIFPNMVFMLYPDMVGFYQEYPVAVDKTIQRFSYYALDDDRRETKLSRYLAERIDKLTGHGRHAADRLVLRGAAVVRLQGPHSLGPGKRRQGLSRHAAPGGSGCGA